MTIETEFAEASSRTVQLPSGGTITLSSSRNYFALSATDREFIHDLLKRMDLHERAAKP